MEDKKAVHHVSPNIEVVKHHKDSLPSWDELKYFIRKYYLFLLIIALIPVVLYSLGQQLANSGSAAPHLQLNSGGKVGVQAGSNCTNDQCYINSECVPKGIGKTSKGVCYNCSNPGSNTYNLNPANCEPSATPIVCNTTGYECGGGSCYAMGGKLEGTICVNVIEPTKTKCGPAECKVDTNTQTCVGTGYECISNECYLRNGQDNGRKDGTNTICEDKKVDLSNCPNRCGQGVPVGTAVPEGGGRVGCSCLDKPGDACTNSDGKDASRIGNSECPPDGAEGQACCRAY